MKKPNIMLVGNGFNYTLKNFLLNSELKDELDNVINLWEEFTELFNDIRTDNAFKNLSNEQIIEIIYNSISLIETLPFIDEETHKRCLNEISEKINEGIRNKLFKIIDNFIEIEENDVYIRLANYYHREVDLNIYEKIMEKNFSIYTTNYDGFTEIIFAYDKNEADYNRIKLRDMFRGCNSENYNCFSFDGFEEDINEQKLLHLHGSYKFFKNQGEYIKIKRNGWRYYRKNKKRLVPVVIFNAPSFKKNHIKFFEILRVYFFSFKKDLKKAKNLIIWGQSLKNDPHLIEVIKKNFENNRVDNKKIIIVDTNEDHQFVKDYQNSNKLSLEFINPKNYSDITEIFEDIFSRT